MVASHWNEANDNWFIQIYRMRMKTEKQKLIENFLQYMAWMAIHIDTCHVHWILIEIRSTQNNTCRLSESGDGG